MGSFGHFVREKRGGISTVVAAVVPLLLLALVADMPRETMVAGRVVKEAVFLGRPVPKETFLAIVAMMFGVVWYGMYRFLGYLLPEDEASLGSVGPEEEPSSMTVTEYLLSDGQRENRSFDSLSDDLRADAVSEARTRWLHEASDETLRRLIPAALAMPQRADEDYYFELVEAYEARGIPDLDELEGYANGVGDADLLAYVAEQRAQRSQSH